MRGLGSKHLLCSTHCACTSYLHRFLLFSACAFKINLKKKKEGNYHQLCINPGYQVTMATSF